MSIDITVDTSQWDSLAVRLVNAPESIAKRFILDGTPLILNRMRNRTPVRTGGLRTSEYYELIDDFHSKVIAPSPGAFVDMPTRPHFIQARNKQALAFRIGGKTVFAKRVFHPGTKGAFFRQGAIEDSMPELIELLREATRQELGA